MNYITDYQLDIERGFQYKIQNYINTCVFHFSKIRGLWYINGFTILTRALDICWEDLLKKFTDCKIFDTIFYCNSKQQCYELCQYIVSTYFKPIDISYVKECSEKSRRYLSKYYNPTKTAVFFPDKSFDLYKWNNEGQWFWRNISIGAHTLYEQFKLTQNQVLCICNDLKLLAYFRGNILIFESTTDAIKFTDYLIETYIIKKEKTYDTNQLRKERTSISRGFEPAGSIIHGRRSKASVRCRHIEHKACVGC